MIVEAETKIYNLDWSTLRIYRLLIRVKNFSRYIDNNILENQGKGLTSNELGDDLIAYFSKIYEDSFMSYIYMKYSYSKIFKYSIKYKEQILKLLESYDVDLKVNSSALNHIDFFKDIVEQNPKIFKIVLLDFISNIPKRDKRRVLMLDRDIVDMKESLFYIANRKEFLLEERELNNILINKIVYNKNISSEIGDIEKKWEIFYKKIKGEYIPSFLERDIYSIIRDIKEYESRDYINNISN